MNYEELIKTLREKQNLGDSPVGIHCGVLVNKQIICDAVDAIEKLRRDGEQSG